MKRFASLLISLLIFTLPTLPAVAAQGDEITYTVQVGDTLSQIAQKYDQNIYRLAAYNNIANPDLIVAGQKLVIPIDGGSGAGGEQIYTVQPGDTLFEIASLFGIRMNNLAQVNNIANVDLLEAGQTLVIPGTQAINNAIPLPPPFESITLSEERIAQGRTLAVSVILSTPADLTAEFEDRPIFLTGDGTTYQGIVGVHALSEVGRYSLAFRATLPSGAESAVAQNVIITQGPYATETIIVTPGRESLLDPATVQAEAEKMRFIWNQVSPEKQWDGPFLYPMEEVRITSDFGTRRSYGGGPVNGFHAGTDFGGSGNPIFAPAPGRVVLAEPLDVRGNAVLIDHGLGVFSGYWHQSESAVQVGQLLNTGDLIGYVGNTGLVTGPHLHWELRVGGIAVNPMQWVEESIP